MLSKEDTMDAIIGIVDDCNMLADDTEQVMMDSPYIDSDMMKIYKEAIEALDIFVVRLQGIGEMLQGDEEFF